MRAASDMIRAPIAISTKIIIIISFRGLSSKDTITDDDALKHKPIILQI